MFCPMASYRALKIRPFLMSVAFTLHSQSLQNIPVHRQPVSRLASRNAAESHRYRRQAADCPQRTD
jgi:hypothetical protein